MVVLVVKGTKFPDEFVYNVKCDDAIAAATKCVCHIQNMRHQVSLQIFSVRELITISKQNKTLDQKLVESLSEVFQEADSTMRAPATVITDRMFDEFWTKLRDVVAALYPKECTMPQHQADAMTAEEEKKRVEKLLINQDDPTAQERPKDKSKEERAIEGLYHLYDNPEIDEDYRLLVYHLRATIDPLWKANEQTDKETAALWFCGKEMPAEEKFSKYAGKNEKSKITVKLAKSGGNAPSKEPRINYDEQREMRIHIDKKRSEFKTLEEPELRDKVIKMTKPEMVVTAKQDLQHDNQQLNLKGVRTIFPNAQVTETDNGSGA